MTSNPHIVFMLIRLLRDQSGNRAPSRPPQETRRYQTADEFVHSILDDRPPNSNVSPSGELYRAIERFHRSVDRVRLDLPDLPDPPAFPLPSPTTMSAGGDRDLRRRFNRDPQTSNTTLPSFSSVSSNPPLPPLRSLVSSRRGSSMSTSGGSNDRPVRQRSTLRNYLEERAVRDEVGDAFETSRSTLRSLLDFDPSGLPLSTPSSALSPILYQSQDHAEDNRRVKRRKLDSDKMSSSFKGFRYGKYGQVEPGQLTMEIVSCDGGLYSNQMSYSAENILKNDSSVYCTKGNRCNIVLRHQGSTAFSLQELVIKAPGSDFSSPVRAGMVFVSMDSDELLRRTAQYQIPYVAATSAIRSTAPTVYSIRHDDDGNAITRIHPRQRRQFVQLEDDDDIRIAQIPSGFNTSPPPFNITTECSADEEEGDEFRFPYYSRRLSSRTPNRIGSLPFESDNSDDGTETWGPPSASYWTFNELSRREASLRAQANMDIDNMTLAQAQEASQIATQEAVRAVGGELMTPLVHFNINRDKNKCTIRFDPPVSGRYILLKMWNPKDDPKGNIDIQGIVANGFAGPRLFPSVQLR